MKKLFLDSDVLLDLLMERTPFVEDIVEIMKRSQRKNITLCVAPTTITNINYIIGRLETKEKATQKRKKLLRLVSIEYIGQSVIQLASDSEFTDFEDAVQNYCAKEAGHQIIITRNVKDYRESELKVLTPKEYLEQNQK